ncbi:MAG: hypothetical protein Q8K88_03115 [Bradyrhizobium sp.]|nr:hypothetical protein [Bradyrhizobium sp.]
MPGVKAGTSSGIGRCFRDGTPRRPTGFFRDTQEGTMATRDHDQIVETAREARGAEPGPSVLALLTVSTGLAVLILGVVWFVFFRT